MTQLRCCEAKLKSEQVVTAGQVHTAPAKTSEGVARVERESTLDCDEIWNGRFRLLRELGKGSFGQVFEAYNIVNGELVAIKVIRKHPSYLRCGKGEIRITEFVNRACVEASSHIVQLKEHFFHRDRLCIVYERLSHNLYQSRFYRAPEILLGHPYGAAIDIWSAGCILAELYCGAPLFAGSSESDQMRRICTTLGRLPPRAMLDAAREDKVAAVFDVPAESDGDAGEVRLRQLPVGRAPPRVQTLAEVFTARRWREPPPPPPLSSGEGAPQSPGQGELDWVRERKQQQFEGLLLRMLELDPRARIVPGEALLHEFFAW
ncbi:Dual specificity tyrosine-phosphorylation-regulated kinase 1B [Cladochytrium tenue]|nr:Dual specificity tyrosine-phosphorylation-regulated kinase 1B [Cladochytrium tenue]